MNNLRHLIIKNGFNGSLSENIFKSTPKTLFLPHQEFTKVINLTLNQNGKSSAELRFIMFSRLRLAMVDIPYPFFSWLFELC
jgi:hypothetical protein